MSPPCLDLRVRLCCVVLAATPHVAAQGPAPSIDATLTVAGANRIELSRSLAEVPLDQRASLEFLLTHMPASDAQTLSAEFLLQQVDLAHAARARAPWGTIDDELFRAFVLPYAQANERREDWRSGFWQRFAPLVADCKSPGEAALRLNAQIFAALEVQYSTARARADQAPSESIAQGKASCTGLAILLADACRAVGVPARVVSVRWPHKAGNHTWVEVWDGAAWRFVGAAEPDPEGFDRAWFVGDAAQCRGADSAHAIWAVSFAATGKTFAAGWTRGVVLHGVDVTARYAKQDDTTVDPRAAADAALRAQMLRFFAADPAAQATFEFDRNLDAELATPAGDARLRGLAWDAFRAAPHPDLRADYAAGRVRCNGYESAYTVRDVGTRQPQQDPEGGGSPLVIAMHGGGGVPKSVNDSQWGVMQRYYKDQPDAGGYRYLALRAPTDDWNGFYTDYVYPLIERLILQFAVCGDVDPARVVLIGYSHGGYGAFAIGPKMPDRFAAVHASAAAPTGGETSAVGLHHLAFSFMVGVGDTAHGRADRCREFAAQVEALRSAHEGRYPVTAAILQGHRHTGLPDRDKLAELVPLHRVAPPSDLAWELTDTVVRDHYWVGVETPAKGQQVSASLRDQRLHVTRKSVGRVRVTLDARLCRLDAPLVLVVDDTERSVQPTPSLRVLCSTLQRRGDLGLAGSFVVDID